MNPSNVNVSFVVTTLNRLKTLRFSIASLRKQQGEFTSQIIVVDGGSTDGTVEWLMSQKDIVTVVQHNHGLFNGAYVKRRSWGYFTNLGIKIAEGDYVCIVSDDSVLYSKCIERALAKITVIGASGPRVGGVAFYWRESGFESRFKVGRTFGGVPFINHGLYYSRVLRDVGLFNESDYQFYFADGDIALRLYERGMHCIPAHGCFVEHFPRSNTSIRKVNRLTEKNDWKSYVHNWIERRPGTYDVDLQGWDFIDVTSLDDTVLSFPTNVESDYRGDDVVLKKNLSTYVSFVPLVSSLVGFLPSFLKSCFSRNANTSKKSRL